GGLSPLVLPAPSAVLATLWSEIATGRLWPHLAMTATEMALGLGIGAVVGLGTGILLAEFPALSRLLRPYVLASQLVPKLALGPLFIIWFGFGMTPTVVITALICFFPLMENTLTGIGEVDASRRVMDSSLIFALFIVITALGMLLYEAVRLIERRVLHRFSKG
ncbi:MAG: ABC transporter permease subunit, partial [Hyphomicrobiales bacterium]